MARWPLGTIIVGDRARKDAGDLSALKASMQALGILHPIVVRPNKTLVAGGRRLAAARELGWAEIDVRVVSSLADALLALRAERDENTCREALKPTEAVSLGEQLEELERPTAKERQREHGGTAPGRSKKNTCENRTQVFSGKTRDAVGDAVGISGVHYQRAKAIVKAAKAEPERFGDLPKKMDETSISAAYRELANRQGGNTGVRKPPRKNRVGKHLKGKKFIGNEDFADLYRRSVEVAREWAEKTGHVAYAKTMEDHERWQLCDTLQRLGRQLTKMAHEMRTKA